jgi:hypothetical protein
MMIIIGEKGEVVVLVFFGKGTDRQTDRQTKTEDV